MQQDVPLAPRTTLGVGGTARFFDVVRSEAELVQAVRRADAEALPLLMLGGGSNIVVHESGWPGLVLSQGILGIAAKIEGERATVTVGAGEDWNGFVHHAASAGWAGIECLAGIPGQVGATPIQNVGAYGQEVSKTIVRLVAYDRLLEETQVLASSDCRFGYRKSRFNTEEPGRFLIVSVTFALKAGGAATLTYRDLQNHFGEGAEPPLLDVYHAVRRIRAGKGMVVDAADPESRSAGSFFKNPVVSAQDVPEGAPCWVQPDGTVKLAAAWLIERAGFSRGAPLVGAARLSQKHPLALVNGGEARAGDIAAAARLLQRGVFERWGITLHPEPLFVGPWDASELPEGTSVFSPA